MDQSIVDSLRDNFPKAVFFNEPMSRHTTFAVGGEAKVFIKPVSLEQLQDILLFLDAEKVKYFILGCGSNILVTDNGFSNTVVISLCESQWLSDISVEGASIICGAGAKISSVLKVCLLNSLSGLEFLCGIPGSVGGALVMNAGAFGEEIGTYIDYVEVINKEGKLRKFLKDELDFSYRQGIDKGIVIRAAFKTVKTDLLQIKEKCCELMRKRNTCQPQGNSAGSVFRNPAKTSAWELIEKAGLRGFSVGDACVSDKHANFIINKGSATAKDINELIMAVQSKVKQETDIWLEPEIKIVGE